MRVNYEFTAVGRGTQRSYDVTFWLRNGDVPMIGWDVTLWPAAETVKVLKVTLDPYKPELTVALNALVLPPTKFDAFLEYMRRELGATVEETGV